MLDALTVATGGLLSSALQIAAGGLLLQEYPSVILPGGIRRRINRTKENDEALLLSLGLL